MSEIRVRVTRADINEAKAAEGVADREQTCAVAQALIRMGFLNVEVTEQNRIYIGIDRYEAIDERPGGERITEFVRQFDDWINNDCAEWAPEPEEFVLRQVAR